MAHQYLEANPGDLVGLASGRITSLVTNQDGDVTGITVDEALPMEAGTDYGVSIRTVAHAAITAQVTQNVYDSPTGSLLLIPQGTRIIGEYDNGVTFGQRRVLLVWNRLIFPDGRSIVLERQPGADASGYAGLEDGVDYHWWDLMKAAGLSTLLAVGAELTMDDDDRLIQAIRSGSQDTINDAGRAELEANGQVFTALYDETLDTGYIFRGRTDASAEVEGAGPHDVSWSGGEALEPVNAFEAMWFAWAAFYPETAVHD
jgi:hypothetical protein